MNPGKHAFVLLECLKEQIDSAWVALAEQTGVHPREVRETQSELAYHLRAAEEYCPKLYQALSQALPGAAALDSGDVAPGILDQIGEAE